MEGAVSWVAWVEMVGGFGFLGALLDEKEQERGQEEEE